MTACAVCGAPVQPPFRAPAPDGAPDLDLRPGEPARSTLPDWIASCPKCGAAGPDLSKLPPGTDKVVQSPQYRSLLEPEWARSHLRWAKICEAAGDRRGQAEAMLQAAWAADDSGDAVSAAAYRGQVAELWGESADLETALRLLDVLRRAGEFERAEAAAARLAGQDLEESAAVILAYQRDRIAMRDAGRHLLSSAIRPPARTPHVAHGKQADAGFFSRFFKR